MSENNFNQKLQTDILSRYSDLLRDNPYVGENSFSEYLYYFSEYNFLSNIFPIHNLCHKLEDFYFTCGIQGFEDLIIIESI
ncbi:uncharacterized protein T551_02947 [Pneumocystis jirovecii RU7]|uniref:Uncharacterized protein n=1 Tax=Pneumocystis jirovecii (strain RU7) TaxID=1408657 RepID=A0A0W4ZHY2_PNEJ7|nr:uncharacterized protein T551_02947 [Pneumocystis jirovecii RU7]KTW27980.1 hypothetical protein T551_02947 [Pneumocystis jirovecii RU7]